MVHFRIKLITLVIIFLGLKNLSIASSESIVINLCLNESRVQARELLMDALEWHLLLHSAIEVGDCEKRWPKSMPYVFRQELELISGSLKNHYQITSALYDAHRVCIFKQVEFIKGMHRQTMMDRAALLANALIAAIESPEEVLDPFEPKQIPPAEINESAHDKCSGYEMNPPAKLNHTYAAELFIGMERSGQSLNLDFMADTENQVLTRSYPIVGMVFSAKLFRPLTITAAIKGAIVPVELLRPLITVSDDKNLLSMFNLYIESSLGVVKTDNFNLDLGLFFSVNYFKLDVFKSINTSFLSPYWQTKEGIVTSGAWFFDVFLASLGFYTGLFPFVHNSALSSNSWGNMGWLAGVYAESMLYPSIVIKFLLEHHGEYLSHQSLPNLRIVSHGTLAYLSLIYKI